MSQTNKKPPRIAEWLLSRTLGKHDRDIVLGDFEEFYAEINADSGALSASTWYWLQTIKSIPLFISNTFYWSGVMFKNYVKIALRNMQKQKLFSFINISGLAIGMTCTIVILLYIKDELSYDRFHENADRIYRVANERISSPISITRNPWVRFPTERDVFNKLPEVENVARLIQHNSVVTRYKDKMFGESPQYVEPTFLEIFTFPLLRGDSETVLREPYTAVVTMEFAEKYFGEEDPMGKVLTVDNKHDYTITGILKEIPKNSHIKTGFLVSISTMKTAYPYYIRGSAFSAVTYLLLREGSSPEELEKKLPDFLNKYVGVSTSLYRYFLQPLTDIYLHSDLDSEFDAVTNDITYSYVLGLIAIIIVLIACINFMNLSTARSAIRAKEVGMRKVVGAYRYQLIKQFIGESVLISLIALLFALVIASIILPYFNSLLSKELSINFITDYYFYIGLIALSILVGFMAGFYPAFFLSSFQPVYVIKGDLKQSIPSLFVRKGLIVFQFTLSVFFIIGTIVIFRQLYYVKNKELGFNAEQIVMVPIFKDRSLRTRTDAMKREFLKHSTILSASASAAAPGYASVRWNVVPEGLTKDDNVSALSYSIDEDYFQTLGLEIIEGRNFSLEFSTDSVNAVIVNETAVKTFGWDDPIGKQIEIYMVKELGNVIGVVKDFHFESFHSDIAPNIFRFKAASPGYFILRLNLDNIPSTIEHIKEVWKQFSPDYILHYSFLEETFENMYRQDKRMQKIFLYASMLAIFIACLGLFGLAAFSAERRTKEIGIRKVLGASISSLVLLLTKEFAKWVILANVIAWPIAYLIMDRWLQNFAYKANIGWWVFILAGILTLAIALITVSYQSIKAATANPIDSLRFE